MQDFKKYNMARKALSLMTLIQWYKSVRRIVVKKGKSCTSTVCTPWQLHILGGIHLTSTTHPR